MASKDKPVFDNCRAGTIINSEAAFYNSLFNESIYEEKDDSDYFEMYKQQQNKNKNYDEEE